MIRALLAAGQLGAILHGDDLVRNLAKFGAKLALRSRKIDQEAGEGMVELMRSRVPVDTGRLLNGITSTVREDGSVVVEASAVRVSGTGRESADYAGFVERGTRAGDRGGRVSYMADSSYFDLSTGGAPGRSYRRKRRVYRSHPGTEAQPFFFDSVEEVLAERGRSMDDAVGDAAGESDL